MSTFVSMTVHCAGATITSSTRSPRPIITASRPSSPASIAATGPTRAVSKPSAERPSNSDAKSVGCAFPGLARQIEALTSPAVAELDDQIKAIRQQLRDTRQEPSRPDRPNNGYHSAIYPQPDATAWVQVDLGATVPIDEIRLFPARPADFPDTPGFGFPTRFHVELSDDPTFARAERVAASERPDHQKPMTSRT